MALKLLLYITILLVLCQMFHEAATQHCSGREDSISDMMLRGHIYKKITGAPLGDVCLRECYRDDRCQSFNYVIWKDVCELNNRTKEARPEDFVPNSDRYYFKRDCGRVPLGSIPKLPAETCKEIKASEGRQAVSGKYWFDSIIPGKTVLARCDMRKEDVDECSASISVCDVDATCTNTRGSYRCSCKPGFTGDGTTCSDVDECNASVSVCDANADCKNTRGSYLCTCKAGFTGNGKTCTAPSVTSTSSCANLLRSQTNTDGIIDSNQISSTSYTDNMDCQWNLSSNAVLELAFHRFNTQPSADYVRVYNGGSLSSPLIGTFSGSSLPAPITSSSNKLYVRFTSDGSGTYRGFGARYRVITGGSIRIHGTSSSTGRVEIYYDGQWGTICDDAWDINDAKVVCRQLGFQQASQAYSSATHGQGTGPIWIDKLACSGSESHIYDCGHRGWGNNNCTHSRDASVQCLHGSSVVRLVNGGYYYGRVEVYHSGQWGTVCDDAWDMNDANVVCRQLGFSSASSAPGSATYGQGSNNIWLGHANCQGSEASLLDCPNNGWGPISYCSHSEDASVVCNT